VPSNPDLTPAEARARLEKLRHDIAGAAARSGRRPGEITLLGVSKTFPAASVRAYFQAGLLDFGESYIQEARVKLEELADLNPPPTWHFIGHLQTNKARYAARLFPVVHSLDNLDLARELNRRAQAEARAVAVYIEINLSGEASKSGLDPGSLPAFLDSLAALPALKLQGLMTMPPYDPDPEASRPYFAALRELRDKLAPDLPGLSMGMSGDFAVAIEEGATIVRVGTALFGRRGPA
jgi:pyridoxal phosphate enzyme (YggS family)